ncbi:hypothetical protein LOTGIDRAFT_173242 [Lottia gigantea]|uniref:G-protein coupled receptors family 1 profile domain-containing protein n=1 Tax=Lottia gigantea TaxID=225164 RepID=V4A8T0_LOTGI|nr:hypothetical protein LOTGIDRAFT_173242 [Lottia gigantea]ESP00339.1 hypothetical protein LOTGIDRAFT_173242 [Lottia gigantea]
MGEVVEEVQLESSSIRQKGELRRSAMGIIERARIRTLKMTLVIVGVFVLCWTPYFVFSAWWWFDKRSPRLLHFHYGFGSPLAFPRESAAKTDPKLRRGLFLFAVSNSCMDPIVYEFQERRVVIVTFKRGFKGSNLDGMFTINFKREFQRCCQCVNKDTELTDRIVNRGGSPAPISRPNSEQSGSSYKNSERVYYRSSESHSSVPKRNMR